MLLDTSFTELKTIDKVIKILPLFSPAIIFLLGYFLRFLEEKRTVLKEIISIESFCVSWLKSSEFNIKKLKQSAYEFSIYIENIDNNPKGFDRNNIMINKINDIKTLQLYNAFVVNKRGDIDFKTKLYFDFSNNIEVLNLNYNSLEDLFNRFTKVEEIFGKQLIENQLKYREYLSSINILDENLLDYNLFLQEAYMSNDEIKLKSDLINNIVLPFRDKYSVFYKKYPNDENLKKLAHILDDIFITYNHWKGARKITADNFKNTVDWIDKCYEKLSLTMNEINLMKFKYLMELK